MVTQQSSPSVEDIARALELTDGLYTNPAIRRYKPDLEEQIAGLNRLHQGDFSFGRVRWLASGQSPRGDFGINKNGIIHVLDALRQGKIAVGIVALTRKLEIVNKSLVSAVWEKIKDARWLDGRGEFCWVDEGFAPPDRDHHNNKYITDPDEPM